MNDLLFKARENYNIIENTRMKNQFINRLKILFIVVLLIYLLYNIIYFSKWFLEFSRFFYNYFKKMISTILFELMRT